MVDAGDVGAVVLTTGEATTPRAVASLHAQTAPVAEVVVVEGVSPFARALNEGALRSTTPFFLQVDADVVLHPRCAEILREAMTESVGIAAGALEDPLMGRVTGIKMFRRECFDVVQVPESVAQDVEFGAEVARLGWSTRWVLGGGRPRMWGPLGEHRPAYDVDYTFGTYFQLGARYAYRGDRGAIHWRLGSLRRSSHPMAVVARLALGRGLAVGGVRDAAKPLPSDADAAFLGSVALELGDSAVASEVRDLLALAPEDLPAAFRELGARLRASSPAAVRGALDSLAEHTDALSLDAEAALGDGVLAPAAAPALTPSAS